MENFFHGKSSGIDPLLCFLNIPLLIESKEEITTIDNFSVGEGNGAIFLINSGIPGKTQPMISIFFEKLKEKGFRKLLKDEFIQYNNRCVEAFLSKDFGELFENLRSLSSWVFKHFKPMIPNSLKELWQYGLQSNDYYSKLCGSGGGGFVLGFAKDYEKAKLHLKNYTTEVIHRF